MPAADPTVAVLTALRAVMTGDATITGIVPTAHIVDAPDPNLAVPMIGIGLTQWDTDDTSTSDAVELSVDVQVFVPAPNTAPLRTILARLRELLHRQPLTVSGSNVIIVEVVRQVGPYATDEEDVIAGVTTVRIYIGH